MGVRELCDGDLQVCRDKAATKVAGIVKGLAGKTDREKFIKLTAEFAKYAEMTAHASENFDPDKFFKRGNEALSDETLAELMKAAVKGGYVMEELTQVMTSLVDEEGRSLAKVNGTSGVFQNCVETLEKERGFCNIGRAIFVNGSNIVVADAPVREECAAIRTETPSTLGSLNAKLCQFLATFLILPETIDALC